MAFCDRGILDNAVGHVNLAVRRLNAERTLLLGAPLA